MFENALFVTFSHPHTTSALRRVVRLVRRYDGRVHALAVIAPAPPLQRMLTSHSTTDAVEQALRGELLHDLSAWTARAAGSRAPEDVTTEVVVGHPVTAVLQRVVDGDHDLLAVTSDPDDPSARAIVKRFQRKAPCPVWAIRPDRSRRGRVLAAVDTAAEHHGLDHRILAAARCLAGPGDELHVVTAWELLGESTLRTSPFIGRGDDEVDALRARCGAEHERAVRELVAEQRFPTDDVHVHVVNGPVLASITGLVERHRINQLVMGTIGRTGLPGFVIGNTAEQLLGEVDCSILVVKPPGFVGPVHG